MQNLKSYFLTFMNHPLITLSMKPISFLLFGTLTGITFNALNGGMLFLLLFFLLATTTMESILSMHERKQSPLPVKALFFFLLLAIVTLVFVLRASNWIVAAILLLYLVYSILQYCPFSMTNTFYSTLLQPFFKVVILSTVAFFVQANFIPADLLSQLKPILFFYLFMIFYNQSQDLRYLQSRQLSNVLTTYQQIIIKFSNPLILICFSLAYLFGFVTLLSIKSAAWPSILFLLSILFILPLLYKNGTVKKSENYLSNYLFFFSLFYSLLFVS
ncbi:Hypothetical protein Tpal_959 [Trichococcus palustris]|jgi:hypothetical protein|uniref:UbiA prenyltransferase family n=1 Tax=Trichococcus palustris TaxID=140314 RepID=A0A143YIL0_9LACT|nr:hypothetical protein [Trichococcus palustris]CZQ87910.1 Hypothetical protein Tpal_959 [Trichococcus palustris]SFL20500.1 hypothetical protein SAMN04488076_1376 [Trichococcus palustris]